MFVPSRFLRIAHVQAPRARCAKTTRLAPKAAGSSKAESALQKADISMKAPSLRKPPLKGRILAGCRQRSPKKRRTYEAQVSQKFRRAPHAAMSPFKSRNRTSFANSRNAQKPKGASAQKVGGTPKRSSDSKADSLPKIESRQQHRKTAEPKIIPAS